MAETVEQLIFRANVALHETKFSDVKKYVEQAMKQADQEIATYLKSKHDVNKEEELSSWYSQCGDIFFKIADLWNSLRCTYTAAIFSEKIELLFWSTDKRWQKLLLQQPREMLLKMHKTLRIFVDLKLGEVANIAVRYRKWKRGLQIDQYVDNIFIWLRDMHSVGPDIIWQNPGRHKAFVRMAKCYFNLNDHNNTRVYCKLVLEHLSEYNDIEVLELFARSLLSTQNFRSALKYCKLAIGAVTRTGDKKRLQNLQSEIERDKASSAKRQHTSKAQRDFSQNSQRVEEQRNINEKKKTNTPQRRRPNRARRLETQEKHQNQVQENTDDSNAQQEKNITIYARISSHTASQRNNDGAKNDLPHSESSTGDEEASRSSSSSSSVESETEAMLNTSSNQELVSERTSDNEETETDDESFYETSRALYSSKEQSKKRNTWLSAEEISDTVVKFDSSFLRTFEDRHPDVLKRKMLYQKMLPVSELNELLDNEQNYVQGLIQIEGPHEAICTPTRSASCSIPIKILGRGKIGQTFNGDEVVVELINDKKAKDKRFGRVIGIYDPNRHENVKQSLMACTLDQESFNLATPICKTIPKIHVLHREISHKYKTEAGRKNKIELYNYDKENGTLRFSKIVHLQREERHSCILIVAYVNWSPRHVYPRGAVIKLLPTGHSKEHDLTVLNILYKVPSLYTMSTVKEVEKLLRNTGNEPAGKYLEGRTDLTELLTFTIDPPDSEDLDDALSVEKIKHEYKVGVHIADVSSYIEKGSEIDAEAQKRSQTFYSKMRNARNMLPDPFSKDVCSLLPNKLRLTLTVFFYIDQLNFVLKRTEIRKSYIKSKRKFTYKEVQEMISIQDHKSQDSITKDIRILFEISENLRKQRLKNASYALEAYFKESPLADDDVGTFEAHSLVEEFMLAANRTVAEKLLQSNQSQCVPLRCHCSPSDDDIETFLEENGSYIDIICKLQDKTIGPKMPSYNSTLDTDNKNVMVFKTIWEAMLIDQAHVTNYLRKDDLHPLQHVIYQNWISIQEHAEYRCSGFLGENEDKHYGLDISPYTHFTSPIRRYIDLVVHRLVHAAILQKTSCPYGKEEIDEICHHANFVSKKAKDYERECKTLRMATILGQKPRIFTCYVNRCTEREVKFCTPSLRGQTSVQREIPFNLLDMSKKPVIKHDENTNSDKVQAFWRKRMYNFHPVVSNIRLEDTQELNPLKDMFLVPLNQWVQLLRSLTERKQVNEKKLCCSDIIKTVTVSSCRGFSDITTECEAATVVEQRTGSNRKQPVVFQPSIKFSMTFSRAQRLNIQMTAVQQKGTTVLKPTLLSLTDNVKFCLQHTDDPVFHLSRYSSNATRDRYKDVKTYRDIWLPILSMEAATGVLKNEESCCLIDRPIIFGNDRTGEFVLDEEECDMRNIEFSGTCFEDKNLIENKAPSYDWLCIKTNRKHVIRNDLQCTANYIWVGHGEITKVNQKSRKLTILFTLHETSRVDQIIFNPDTHFNIEILKKSEVDRRTESFIRELENESLAAEIALRKPITNLDDDLVKIAAGMDKDLLIKIKDENAWKPLPRNNTMQKVAISKALRSRFTLIQGPPGTGKTQTAIKLICLFTKINNVKQRQKFDRNQVLFCGPSNKSVDLVAKWMLNRMGEHRPKFIRVYGRTIESEKFPIPGRNFLSERSTKNQSEDPELESVALHHLIRQPENEFAEEIQAFDEYFKVNNVKPMPRKEKEYAKLIAKASIAEMRKYDVILCTTAVGTNPKLLKATDISQIIVDEAGMCPEPNCLVPLIATNAEQVVLIGDHKQLRPIIMCKEAAALGLETSLFERYADNPSKTNVAFTMLNEQYRMNPQICKFPSEQFYGGALKTGKGRWCDDNLTIWPHKDQEIYPHVFIDIEGEEKILTVSTAEGNEQSRSNRQEVDHVVKVYRYFTREQPSDSVQIISQYNAQCHEIKVKLKEEGFVDVNVSTVVSSQGGEWDYVIFSTVRSLPHYKIERNPTIGWCKHNLGFITDRNQVNVALTRARKGLIIIGNKHLLSCDEVFKDLLDHYEVRGCILSPERFPPPFKKTRQQIMSEAKRKHGQRHGSEIFKKGQATSYKGPVDDKPGFRKK